jgi:two-component system CheB/CheR fusion protein
VAGCSTGEEAYSLAIVLDEALAELGPGPRHTVQIFATDLDKDAIDRARAGRYPATIAADVSAERLARYFVHDEQGVRVCQEIRERIIFAVQNVIMDPPFTKLDLVSCRNLLIYLSAELQRRLLPTFHYGLLRGGILFLGSSETIGTSADSFEVIDAKSRIYRCANASSAARALDFPSAFTMRPPDGATVATRVVGNLQAAAERLILARFGPALVLTNREGDILFVHGRTGRYLEPAAGKANWNIHSMARDGLRSELGAGVSRAFREKKPVSLHALHPEHDDHAVDVSIEVLHEPSELRDMVMIAFTDLPKAHAQASPSKRGRSSAIVAELELELRTVREALQATREDMQSSTEERTAGNEELQSTNEELQSTNEELTTSKEEMQSLNEELQSTNAELQSKLDELSRTNDDMRNLLDSTDIATLFLDDALQVRRFTPQMLKIIKLLPGDVHRPITDLASDLVYPRLVDDAREVLRSLVFRETSVTTVDGRWFTVRIMPYRTLGNRIDGVVITFVDITAAKALEAQLRKAQADRETGP